ncbi:uncharacterized protein LOC106674393 [Cimex lectularius]|uniref:DUF4485 domain-containing protein n=1 Tax=Cimex lectularius TaxID=79782 RepID=A0A8I6SR23_CIMLE|nr:uncharacterized protein LOC106674393 [Cimex lectularius]
MALKEDITEFQYAVREICSKVIFLKSHFDRVKVTEWVRKLATIPTTTFEQTKLRNDYIQLLRITVLSGILHGIFVHNPPSGELPPLAEAVGAEVVRHIPKLAEVGPIAPFMCHKSPDGKAIVSIKKLSDEGVMCYLAVAPEGL